MMPGTQRLRDSGIVGQRHHTTCAGNASAGHDQRAVVQRRIVEENISQQRIGYLGIDLGASLHVLLQGIIPGEYDQRAHFFLAQLLTSHHRMADDGIHILGGVIRGKELADLHIAQMIQNAADLRCKQNHQCQQTYIEHLLHHIMHGIHIQKVRYPGDQKDSNDALENLQSARRPEQRQHLINQKSYHENIQIVGPLHTRQLIPHVIQYFSHSNSPPFLSSTEPGSKKPHSHPIICTIIADIAADSNT